MSSRSSRLTRFGAILGFILAGALVLALGPAGILADDEETTSGIDQFQPITITEQTVIDLRDVAEDLDPMTMVLLYMEMQDFGELETDLSEDSFREVDGSDDVEAHLGDRFVEPSYLPDGLEPGDTRYMIGDAGFASYTFDVAKAHRISGLLELPTDWLPDANEHPELTVSLHVVESGVVAWKNGQEKLVAGQIGVPELDVPESLDLEALREAIVNDPRMPAELQNQLGAIEDWERTLPVPVPDDAESQDITINGNSGLLVTMDDGSAIVWESDGVLYFVAGTFDGNEIERVAESMN
jgi:hypothetical protein